MKQCMLVTGGAGFIGTALSKEFAGHELPFVAYDNLHPQIHPSRERPIGLATDAALFIGDVCSRQDWDRLLARYAPKVIVHLAAETGTGQSLTESTRHAQVNVVGTTQMLDALSRHEIFPDRIVLSSSRAVYGEGAWQRQDGAVFYPGQRDARMLASGAWDFPGAHALPFDASRTRPGPTSVYGATKLAQEHVLESWCRSYDVECAILRLQNVYGPGQALGNPYTGIVPLFSRLAKSGQSIPVYEDGRMLRDFVFIDDVAHAIWKAVVASPIPPSALDIGSGKSMSIMELARFVAQRYGAPEPHVCGLYRNGDVRHAACQPEAAMQVLDWTPKVTAAEGLDALCAWLDDSVAEEGNGNEQ